MENMSIPTLALHRAMTCRCGHEALGLNVYTGAYVVDVTPGGPADQAGIRAAVCRPASMA